MRPLLLGVVLAVVFVGIAITATYLATAALAAQRNGAPGAVSTQGGDLMPSAYSGAAGAHNQPLAQPSPTVQPTAQPTTSPPPPPIRRL
ncbi:MAG: hypothetical protein ACYDGM_13600 [Vulcanimicrobiaceae bacterium]